MILVFQVPKSAIFNIFENDFFSIQGLIFFNIGSSGFFAGDLGIGLSESKIEHSESWLVVEPSL